MDARHRTPDQRPQLRPPAGRLAATGRARPGRRAHRPDPAAGARRPAAAADPGPGRARAGGRARRQPDHGGRRLRGAARRAACCAAGAARAAGRSCRRSWPARPGVAVLPARRPRRTVRPGARRAAGPVGRAARGAAAGVADLDATWAGTATSCSGCRRCGRRSPTGSPPAGCRPGRTRSWSPRAASTPSRSRWPRWPARATGCWWSTRPTPTCCTRCPTCGARPVPVPMGPGRPGRTAWDLDLLTAAVRDAAPRLAYLIPDFQNPTGAQLDAPAGPGWSSWPAAPAPRCWSTSRWPS